ncbi:MAG TPA: RING finger protein [Ignavibacteria bacterium]|nr:RING finger protein [Ignavibacteria bacterium]
MENLNPNITKSTCQFCQSNFKQDVEIVTCPSCHSLYHKECWIENSGCGVYGCNYKIKSENYESVSFDEIKINIEYLINEKKYHEAIAECKKILKIDRRNTEIKKLYNTAVHLINSKTKLIENGDIAFDNKDYKSAEIYYSNSFKYLDEDETEFYKSRISIIKEKIPLERNRKVIQSVIIAFIVMIICGVSGYGYYYFYFLEEERTFAEIEKNDEPSDIQKMEIQISKYESFMKKHKQPDLIEKANDKINYFSGLIANSIYKDDWKNANRYLNKIDYSKNPVTYKEIYSKILEEAKAEYKNRLNNAKKLDIQKKYSDSKTQIENAVEIINLFPESEINSDKLTLNSNISLLNKKISSQSKYSSINEEINEKLTEVKKFKNTTINSKILNIKAKILEFVQPSTVLAKIIESDNFVAFRNPDVNLKIGETLNFECIRNGNIEVITTKHGIQTVPLYIPAYYHETSFDLAGISPEMESIEIRLEYLYDQKSKLDSILNLPLKF